MSARFWTQFTLTAACLACSASNSIAETGKPAAAPQARPAPVTGHIGGDPAAVALRPASARSPSPQTSTAVQVPPPANPNEPLLPASADAGGATAPAHSPQEARPATPSKHVDHTQGVKKPRRTEPQKLAHKAPGKPRQKTAGKPGAVHEHEGNRKVAVGHTNKRNPGEAAHLSPKAAAKPGEKPATAAYKLDAVAGSKRASKQPGTKPIVAEAKPKLKKAVPSPAQHVALHKPGLAPAAGNTTVHHRATGATGTLASNNKALAAKKPKGHPTKPKAHVTAHMPPGAAHTRVAASGSRKKTAHLARAGA